MKKNVASQVIGAQMITAADGTAFTGAVSVVVTIDGGTQSAGGGTGPTHEGNGYHSYIPTQPETNGDIVAFTFTGTGAIPVTVQVYTTFPQTVDNATNIAAIKTDTAAILVDTGTTLDAALAVVDANVDAILVDTGTTLDAALAVVDANVDAILADTGTDGVVVAAGSKTGYSLANVDGVAFADYMESILAALFGVAAPSGSTVAFKKRDGTTTKVTVTYGASDGERTGSVIA